jgi:hypothetical protein
MSASNSKFFRLYRELDKSMPDEKVFDESYHNERMEVMQYFPEYNQYINKKPEKFVARPKFHGKLVREMNHGFDNERRELLERKKDEFRRNRKMQAVILESDKIKGIIDNLAELALERQAMLQRQ